MAECGVYTNIRGREMCVQVDIVELSECARNICTTVSSKINVDL